MQHPRVRPCERFPRIRDDTGGMGLCCRHDVALVFCNIAIAREQHQFAFALLEHIRDAVPALKHFGVWYDNGCRFATLMRVNAVISTRMSWAVSMFHIFGHSVQGQVLYSSRNRLGFGWSSLEGMERIWSALSTLVMFARSMSHGDRRHTLGAWSPFRSPSKQGNISQLDPRPCEKSYRVKANKVIRSPVAQVHALGFDEVTQRPKWLTERVTGHFGTSTWEWNCSSWKLGVFKFWLAAEAPILKDANSGLIF
ncbi:hypothetical protein V8E36_002785 [Tilletia maclaganii]